MKVLVQRVQRAAVAIDGQTVSKIGKGLVLLVGVGMEDDIEDIHFTADKCSNLRIFEDDSGKMNLSVLDIGGQLLVISQFTLCADTKKGRRPNFTDAAPPQKASQLYNRFVDILKKRDLKVETGAFGQRMLVEIHNDGPVTLMVESPK